MFKRICWSISLALVAIGAQAQTTNVDEIIQCASANAPEKSFVQTANLKMYGSNGQAREVEIDFSGQRGRQGLLLNVRVRAPADLAGTVVLLREAKEGQDDMRIYLPALRRVRRVTGAMASTKLFGSDFSYQDLRQIYGSLGSGSAEYLELSTWEDRPVHRILLHPSAEQVTPYSKLIASIDQNNCVLQTVEFFAEDNRLLKRLDADVNSVSQIGEHHLVQTYVMRDLIENTRTEVSFKNWIFDEEIARSAFIPSTFQDYNRKR